MHISINAGMANIKSHDIMNLWKLAILREVLKAVGKYILEPQIGCQTKHFFES